MSVLKEKTNTDILTFQGKDYRIDKASFQSPYSMHLVGDGIFIALGKSGSKLDRALVVLDERTYNMEWPLSLAKVDTLSAEFKFRNPLDMFHQKPQLEIIDSVVDFTRKNPAVLDWLEKPRQ